MSVIQDTYANTHQIEIFVSLCAPLAQAEMKEKRRKEVEEKQAAAAEAEGAEDLPDTDSEEEENWLSIMQRMSIAPTK